MARVQHHFTPSSQESPSNLLGSLEDLFYAIVAKLKDFRQQANTLLENRFKKSDDLHIVFTTEPLNQLACIRLGDFLSCVQIQQSLLLGEPITHLLDHALCRLYNRSQNIPFDSILQMKRIEGKDRRPFKAETTAVLYPWLREMTCLRNISQMSSGMLFAYLVEKYHFSCETSGINQNLPSAE